MNTIIVRNAIKKFINSMIIFIVKNVFYVKFTNKNHHKFMKLMVKFIVKIVFRIVQNVKKLI